VIDGASSTFRVRLELPNADFSLPAGLRCKVDLGGGLAPRAGPSPARAYPPPLLQFDPVANSPSTRP
jgi:hypothetical protein